MHLEDHLHEFVVYMKSKNIDFPDILLQQFNFHPAEEDALKDEDQLAPKEAEGAELETDNSLGEEE